MLTTAAADTVVAVFTAEAWGPSADELKIWNKATPYLAADTVATTIGLFTEDLTSFRTACAISTACTARVAEFTVAKFTGTAIGVQWVNTAVDTSTYGICFSDKDCVDVTYGASANVLDGYTSVAAPSATEPMATVTTKWVATSAADPFVGWNANSLTTGKT